MSSNFSVFFMIILVLVCTGLVLYIIILRKQISRVSEIDNQKLEHADLDLLSTLIDYMPDFIYIKDRKSRFIVGNKFLANIMGVKSAKELVGKTDFDFYDRHMAEGFFKDEQEIIKTGISIINKEEKGLDINGNEIVVSTTKVPFKNQKGKIIGIIGIGRDITNQKLVEQSLIEQQNNLKEINILLEESQEEIKQQSEELHSQSEHLIQINHELEKLSLVASHTDNVIIIMNSEANIEWGNHRFEEEFQTTLSQLTSGVPINLRKISYNDEINKIIDEVLETKKASVYEGKVIKRDGKEAWFQTTISPVIGADNKINYLIAIDSDISSIKNAEMEINRQKNELEKNRDKLRKLNATKDKFFSIIAHDLKNPFHSIIGFSDLLVRNYDTIEEARKKEFLSLIKTSSTSAYNLLENLLNWSRAQTNAIKFNPTNINISQLLVENIQIDSVIAQNKDIEIIQIIPDQLMSFADGNMVNTIFRNLLTNALKFTGKGGKITVKAGVENDKVIISIQDSGQGMSPEIIDKLFKIDEYHNTAGTSGETGTGLGLIICQEFISIHGESIMVESKPGDGSKFSFSLPLGKADIK